MTSDHHTFTLESPVNQQNPDMRRQADVQNLLRASSVPEWARDSTAKSLFKAANINSIEVIEFIEKITSRLAAYNKGAMLILGLPGAGKTSLLYALTADYCRNCVPAAYTLMQDIGYQIRATYNDDEGSEHQVFAKLCSPQILCVDDLLSYTWNDFEKRTISYLLEKREQLRKRTILAAPIADIDNKTAGVALGKIGRYAADRIRYGMGVTMIRWGNLRRQ